MEYGRLYYLPDDYLEPRICKARREYKDYSVLGAHFMEYEAVRGVHFAVLAPHAEQVSVAGQFNNWDGQLHPMRKVGNTGVWHVFIVGLEEMHMYKYQILTKDGRMQLKADPYAFCSERRPGTASRCAELNGYCWSDQEWTALRKSQPKLEQPINVYEVHLGSWKRKETGEYFHYREVVEELLDYVTSMGYTHLELLPLMEHPFDGSWGYQVTGYFSLTSRYGSPTDFMYFVDRCHQRGIGVLMDWVPVHFCKDEHGLACFDGSSLYEYDESLMAEIADWGTAAFDHSKNEVAQFLISNALFWLDVYHIDGLRVDAVSYMLYLDAGRPADKWLPNKYGGRENLGAIRFLRKLNKAVAARFPWALMIAEEATAWPNVTGSARLGGLGFDLKWNMGWMNDVLRYMEMDPIYRKWHHHLICFSFVYAFSEKYILPLSHDEVVHGKKSLLSKMPGDYWSKFANLRLLLGYMIGHPGKKLLFMGGELGHFIEWNEEQELDWILLQYESHRKMKHFAAELNKFYKSEKAFYQLDSVPEGFAWIDSSNCEESIIAFMRKSMDPEDFVIILCNFTPVMRQNYRLGVPKPNKYYEVFNTDLQDFGGKGNINAEAIAAEPLKWNNQPYSISVTLPPLSVVFFKQLTQTSCTSLRR